VITKGDETTVLTIGETITTESNRPQRPGLVPCLVFIGLVTAVLGSLGAPLVPTVASSEHVSYVAAQWTLTVSMLAGAVTTPVFGKLGDGPRRKTVVLMALSIVLAGCILAALPTGFFGLVVGRALQGFGIGLTALVIGVANEAFEGVHARAVAGLLSVTTVAGVGIGYPLAGLATHLWGLPGAYAAGAVIVGAALVSGALTLPSSSSKKPVRTDILGAVLLAVAVGGLLFAVSQAATDIARVWVVAAAALGVVVGAIWVWWELRTSEPLVQLRLLRVPAVLAADIAMLLGGIGIYVLISVAIRLVQTPTSSGYGFGASVITAGLMLTPFSATAFLASRTIPPLVRRSRGNLLLPAACGLVLLCLVAFAFLHGSLWEVFVVMTVAGYGVGALYAATPGFIVRSAPQGTTTSAMSFNLVLTTIGGAIGSALSALVLQAATAHGASIPTGHGYVVAAFVGAGALAVAVLLSYLLRPRSGYVGGNEPALAE
jgi:MFS family permease